MKNMRINIVGLLTLAALVSCTSTQEKHSAVEDVQKQYDELASQAYVQKHAPQYLSQAEKAVERADKASQRDAAPRLIEHFTYLAEQRIAIAEEAAKLGRAEASIRNAESERRQVLLGVREAQATRAQERAEQAERRAEELDQTLANLENEVESLQTEKTREGIVLTLQDILFDLNKADLNPGAARTLDRVATFLKNYEDRQLEIRGFTDSTGPADYNRELSERRAQSVMEALIARGISPDRINIEGLGEQHPVASNDTSTGRQQNRRVEIVIENPQREVSAAGISADGIPAEGIE